MFRCCYKKPEVVETSTKTKIACGLCSKEKTIITLECKHMYCMKCYLKYKCCLYCEKEAMQGIIC